MNMATGMYEWRRTPACRPQLLKNLSFARQVFVTEGHIEITIGKLRVKKAVERKTVFAALPMEFVIEQYDPPCSARPSEQVQDLFSKRAKANDTRFLHLVATKPRYLNMFRDTGNARWRASFTTAAWPNNSSREAVPLLMRKPSPRNQ